MITPKQISPAFDKVQQAASTALDSVRGASGQETDPDLELYNQIRPADFPALMQHYGTEGVLQYIKTMEAKIASKANG